MVFTSVSISIAIVASVTLAGSSAQLHVGEVNEA